MLCDWNFFHRIHSKKKTNKTKDNMSFYKYTPVPYFKFSEFNVSYSPITCGGGYMRCNVNIEFFGYYVCKNTLLESLLPDVIIEEKEDCAFLCFVLFVFFFTKKKSKKTNTNAHKHTHTHTHTCFHTYFAYNDTKKQNETNYKKVVTMRTVMLFRGIAYTLRILLLKL